MPLGETEKPLGTDKPVRGNLMAKTAKRNGYIEIKGARENNLKNIDVLIPQNRFTVVTGLSGSGKSSLVLDTVYKEGLRRYIDCLSTYARQFIEKVERPAMDDIEGLPTPIAIESRNNVINSRSTVGTTTEIYDYMRLLFAKIGKTHCPGCEEEVMEHSPQSLTRLLLEKFSGKRAVVCFETEQGADLSQYMKKGYSRTYRDGKTRDMEESIGDLDAKTQIVTARTTIGERSKSRITEALEAAFSESSRTFVHIVSGQSLRFSRELCCDLCDIAFEKPTPNTFSFNSPYGACERCSGFGRNLEIDPELLVPDPGLSLAEGAIEPFTKTSYRRQMRKLLAFAEDAGIDTEKPFSELSGREEDLVLNGNEDYHGVKGYFKRLERKNYKTHIRVFLSRYRSAFTCEDCGGGRLKQKALNVQIEGKSIFYLSQMSVKDLKSWFDRLTLSAHELEIASDIMKEINSRLDFLIHVGLDYLTLSRLTRTLSGGEAQRINLACQMSSRLTETLYILDEPSIGLHPRDMSRLNSLIKELRGRNNTIILIEHDLDTVKSADYIVELGPRAGDAGGEVVYQGTLKSFLRSAKNSTTKKYLANEKRIEVPASRRKTTDNSINVIGASENNLKSINVCFPLGTLTCVTGVSGSGKSSLVNDILYNALLRKFRRKTERVGKHERVEGTEYIDDVIILDQASIGRTSRSNPVTYIKVYDDIRKILAGHYQAKLRKLTPSHFSFNVKGGRCEKCMGEGSHRVEMHFLADVMVTCEECGGKRFGKEVLTYRYKGKNIDDILNLTVDQAMDFFSGSLAVTRKLKVLKDVGCGYLRLGQPATTLSGGEAQRIKIARELSKKEKNNILYILDEPTVGLHIDDIGKLLSVLNRLVDAGNSVIVIEHNLEMIKCADHVIDLGPEGGDKGGRIVAAGTPEQVASVKNSYTGEHLRPLLG